MPVIVEVSAKADIRPERPLSMSVIACQSGLIASPISAATVAMVGARVDVDRHGGQHLWNKHRILTVAIKPAEFEGLRVSANLYTTPDEIDRFCDAVEDVVKRGLPKA